MNPVVHALLAWFLAILTLMHIRDRRWAVVAGIIPDLDGTAIIWNRNLFYQIHHTWGHALFFGLGFMLLAILFGVEKKKLFFVGLGTFSLHLLADIFGSNWPINPLFPFTNLSLSISPFFSDSLIYFVINPFTFIACAIGVIVVFLTIKKTPLEFFSSKIDSWFTKTYDEFWIMLKKIKS